MAISITARHFELKPEISDYVHKRLDNIPKYFDKIIRAQVVLNAEKKRFLAEAIVSVSGTKFNAKSSAADVYSAIDLLADKIKNQVRKHKEKVKFHRKLKTSKQLVEIMPENDDIFTKPSIVERKPYEVKTLTPAAAVKEMSVLGTSFMLFFNSDSEQLNILYQRNDGHFGLMEVDY